MKRSRLPKQASRPQGVFFEDAFEQGFNGAPPDSIRPATEPRLSLPNGEEQTGEQPDEQTTAPATGPWSSIVTATTIEDELKAITLRTADALQTEGHFKGQGYLQLQQDFNTAAILFGIIESYDGEIRWKRDSRTMRDRLAQSASHARVASVQVFAEAKQRQAELQDLIRGSALGDSSSPSELSWSDVADRRMMMKRLANSVQDQLAPWVASTAEWRKHREEIIHQAELTAALARVLFQPGMTDAGDDDYDRWSLQLEAAATAIAQAARDDQYSVAREAQGQATKSCTECHGVYRAE